MPFDNNNNNNIIIVLLLFVKKKSLQDRPFDPFPFKPAYNYLNFVFLFTLTLSLVHSTLRQTTESVK